MFGYLAEEKEKLKQESWLREARRKKQKAYILRHGNTGLVLLMDGYQNLTQNLSLKSRLDISG